MLIGLNGKHTASVRHTMIGFPIHEAERGVSQDRGQEAPPNRRESFGKCDIFIIDLFNFNT